MNNFLAREYTDLQLHQFIHELRQMMHNCFCDTCSTQLQSTIKFSIFSYRPQSCGSYGKVMFLHRCAILFTRRGGLCPGVVNVQGVSVRGGLCPGGSLRGGSLSRGVSQRRISVQWGVCQGDHLPYGNMQAVCILLECILVLGFVHAK